MSLLGFVSDFYKSPNKFVKHPLLLRLSYIVYNKSTKDNLIGSLIYFYKNEEEKCHFRDLFPTFTNPQTNL